MQNKSVQFRHDQAQEMAIFIAELTRQGVTYEVVNGIEHWAIELTGGF